MPESDLVFTLNETVVHSVARLVDDAGATREPSHSDLENLFKRVGLGSADPHLDPTVRVGKQKRVRSAFQWAMDNDESAGVRGVASLIAMVRGFGGFRPESSNFSGEDCIATCIEAFQGQAVELTSDGILRLRSLDGLSGRRLSEALHLYVSRGQKRFDDSVLVAGTGKDLMEATAAHVLTERYGSYSQTDFPTLPGQVFSALGLRAQRPREEAGGLVGAQDAMTVSLYELSCAVNRLRNRAGSGHGRPFLPELSPAEVRAATEAAGLVAGRMLDELDEVRPSVGPPS
jgi:hypothetical protein